MRAKAQPVIMEVEARIQKGNLLQAFLHGFQAIVIAKDIVDAGVGEASDQKL